MIGARRFSRSSTPGCARGKWPRSKAAGKGDEFSSPHGALQTEDCTLPHAQRVLNLSLDPADLVAGPCLPRYRSNILQRRSTKRSTLNSDDIT